MCLFCCFAIRVVCSIVLDQNRVNVRRSKLIRHLAPRSGDYASDGVYENHVQRHKAVGPRVQSDKLHESCKRRL